MIRVVDCICVFDCNSELCCVQKQCCWWSVESRSTNRGSNFIEHLLLWLVVAVIKAQSPKNDVYPYDGVCICTCIFSHFYWACCWLAVRVRKMKERNNIKMFFPAKTLLQRPSIVKWSSVVDVFVWLNSKILESKSKWNKMLKAVMVIIIIITNILIITTRPKSAYSRQGLAGVSLCAFGAQIGRMIVCDTQTDRQTDRQTDISS